MISKVWVWALSIEQEQQNSYLQQVDDENGVVFYDQPEYDIFWKTCADLDIVVYIHPR